MDANSVSLNISSIQVFYKQKEKVQGIHFIKKKAITFSLDVSQSIETSVDFICNTNVKRISMSTEPSQSATVKFKN